MCKIGRHRFTTEEWETNGGWTIRMYVCWECGNVKFIKTWPTFN